MKLTKYYFKHCNNSYKIYKNRGVIENLPNLAVELTWDTFNKVFDIWDAMAAGNLIPIITGHDGDY